MNTKDRELLQKLKTRRRMLAESLNNPAISGVKDIVTNLYDENAHFIYELIQNSDDAGATNITFILTKECIILLHDGTRDFTISDPDTEKSDKENGLIGDLNSILSIANSNKTFDGNKIGKFGCGFKSVFRYTETPVIINNGLNIKIVDYVSLEECDKNFVDGYKRVISNELSKTKSYNHFKNELSTIIILPFKINEREKAYNDIENRLKNLVRPIIFLECVNSIQIVCDGNLFKYEKVVNNINTNNTNIELQFIKYCSPDDNSYFWKVSRNSEKLKKYSVLYESDQEGKELKPSSSNIYCYFETRKKSPFKFIVNGSFRLNPSRTQIIEDERNTLLETEICELAVDSLSVLSSVKAYGEEVITYFKDFFNDVRTRNRIVELSNNEQILPCKGRSYTSLKNAKFLDSPILDLFTEDEVRGFFKDDEIKFIFPGIELSEFKESIKVSDSLQKTYSLLCGKTFTSPATYIKEFDSTIVKLSDIVQFITENYMQDKFDNDLSWIEKLYLKTAENSEFECFLKCPIFYTKKNHWLSEDNEIFIGGSKDSDYESINNKLLAFSDKISEYLTNKFKKFSWRDELNKYVKQLEKNKISSDLFFKRVFKMFISFDNEKHQKELADKLSKVIFLRTKNGLIRQPADLILFENQFWREVYPDSIVVDKKYYKDLIINHKESNRSQKKTKVLLEKFYNTIIIDREYVKVRKNFEIDRAFLSAYKQGVDITYGRWPRYEYLYDNTIKGVYELLSDFGSCQTIDEKKQVSLKIFKIIKWFLTKENSSLNQIFYIETGYGCYFHQQNITRPSLLRYVPFLFDRSDKIMEFDSLTHNFSLSDFNPIYDLNDLNSEQLNELSCFFQISDDHDIIIIEDDTLTNIKKHGYTKADIDEATAKFHSISSKYPGFFEMFLKDDKDISDIINILIEHDSCNDNFNKTIDSDSTEAFSTKNESLSTCEEDFTGTPSAEGLNLNFSNSQSFSSLDRKKFNQTVTLPYGKDFLLEHGYDLSNTKEDRNILIGVSKPNDNIVLDICVKSSSRNLLKFSSHEIMAMKKCLSLNYNHQFMLLLLHNHEFSIYSFDDIWKSNEEISVSCKIKDFDTNGMADFLQGVMYLKGSNLILDVRSFLGSQDSILNLNEMINNVDSDYVNTSSDGDDY